jgi:vacuolar-type H+-ATPase subunit I/STV1
MRERKRHGRRGFVTNELPIVFVIACVLCFLLVSVVGGPLAWYWKALSSIGLAVVGFVCLFGFATVVEALRKRGEARRRPQPPNKAGGEGVR